MTTKSSESTTLPLPTSFSSLPNDLALNILARISLSHRPTLSLVSKSFRSLLASPELYATRSLIGKTEDCIYVCLDLNKKSCDSRWFTLAPTPKQQKLIPIPSCPCDYLKSSTVVSIGSDIYIIGGYTRSRTSRSVFLLDSRSHQWRRLPGMCVGRGRPAAEVIDGKIYVIGGFWSHKSENWGEVYDPKTQTWEPLLPTTLDLTTRKSVVPGRLVMGGKIYDMNGLMLSSEKNTCLVEMDKNVFCQIGVCGRRLIWWDAKEDLGSSDVMGLEELPYISYYTSCLVSMANSCGGRRVTIWWWENREIWCAEISFERRSFEELWGLVEWSKSVFDGGYDSHSDLFLHSALVTH